MTDIPAYLNPFLSKLAESLKTILADNLSGVYLHGSLTYGGYVRGRSDIDVLVIINNEFTPEIVERLNSLFVELSCIYSEEVKNIELDTLLVSEIAAKPVVLHSQYTFMNNGPKGTEMLDGFWIELSNTRENGIVLIGSDPKETIPAIDQNILIEANRQKFNELQKKAAEWEKINLWNQTYILVQASRVLYSLGNGLRLVSKQNALIWAIQNAPEQFKKMLETTQAKLDNCEGPREQIISDHWRGYFEYVEDQFKG